MVTLGTYNHIIGHTEIWLNVFSLNLELGRWSLSPTLHNRELLHDTQVFVPQRLWSIMRFMTCPGSLLHQAEYQQEANKTRG